MKNIPPRLFDRRLYRERRSLSASRLTKHDFLHRRAFADIIDRLETVTRDFDLALMFGVGPLAQMLTPECGVKRFVCCDLAATRLSHDAPGVVCDEEAMPFAPSSVDLIISLLMLHNVNDLVGALTQMRVALRPNGLLIAALFGEQTLMELRRAMQEAELEAGGAAMRVAPMASVRDLGSVVQRAGFALPVADVDRVKVAYREPLSLFSDLSGMGETAVFADRAPPLSRHIAAGALSNLKDKGGEVTFEIVTLTGWAPHESQQKPLKPGSAVSSLRDAVRKSEQ